MPSNLDTTYIAYSDFDLQKILPFATPQFMQDYSSLRQRQIITQEELETADTRLNQIDQEIISINEEIALINERIEIVEAIAFMAVIT